MVHAARNLRGAQADVRYRPVLARAWPLGADTKRIYTVEDDGLKQPWHGLAFMNPPFGGRNGHVPWLRKFFEHRNGVAIVRAYTSSAWWHAEMHKAELILFPKGKTKFIRPDGSIGKCPGHEIVLIGMGAVACEALSRSKLGMIWDRRKFNEGGRR